jgi:PadR family transcriptional regulator, regulatory protein PadR
MRSELLKGHLDPLVLALLDGGPLHGYGIIEKLRLRSDEVFDLPEGTVYPALYRLERAGLVTSTRTIVAGRSRRVYQLAAPGRAALRESRRDWLRFSSAVSVVLGASPA